VGVGVARKGLREGVVEKLDEMVGKQIVDACEAAIRERVAREEAVLESSGVDARRRHDIASFPLHVEAEDFDGALALKDRVEILMPKARAAEARLAAGQAIGAHRDVVAAAGNRGDRLVSDLVYGAS